MMRLQWHSGEAGQCGLLHGLLLTVFLKLKVKCVATGQSACAISAHRKDAPQRCDCGQISATKIEEAAAEQVRRLGKNPRIVNSIVQKLPMLASYNVPALLAKAPNLISHIPDAAMKELFRLVYKRIAFNPATGAFQAECHNI